MEGEFVRTKAGFPGISHTQGRCWAVTAVCPDLWLTGTTGKETLCTIDYRDCRNHTPDLSPKTPYPQENSKSSLSSLAIRPPKPGRIPPGLLDPKQHPSHRELVALGRCERRVNVDITTPGAEGNTPLDVCVQQLSSSRYTHLHAALHK